MRSPLGSGVMSAVHTASLPFSSAPVTLTESQIMTKMMGQMLSSMERMNKSLAAQQHASRSTGYNASGTLNGGSYGTRTGGYSSVHTTMSTR